MSVCVIVAYGKDNLDKATVGLTWAAAVLESGDELSIILASEGVRLAVQGYAETMHNGEPFQPVSQLLSGLLEKGGSINVCVACLKKRKIAESDLLPGCRLISGADVIRIVKRSGRSIQL